MVNNKYKTLNEEDQEKNTNEKKILNNSQVFEENDEDMTSNPSTDDYAIEIKESKLYYLPPSTSAVGGSKGILGQSTGKLNNNSPMLVSPKQVSGSPLNSPKIPPPLSLLNELKHSGTVIVPNTTENDNSNFDNIPLHNGVPIQQQKSMSSTPTLSSTSTSLIPPEPIQIEEIEQINSGDQRNIDDDEGDFLNTIRQITKFKFKRQRVKKRLRDYFIALVPIIQWLPQYNWKSSIKSDLTAGLTVGVMLIPQGMAYSLVAGLPPIYGLYSSIIPVLAYAIFGTSRQLSVGPFAIISLLVSETVNGEVGIDNHDTQRRISVAILLAFVCGLIQIVLGLLRFGFVANFLSDPVKTGFTSGCALIIGSSQIKHIFGYAVENSNFLALLMFRYLKDIKQTNWWSFLLATSGILMLYAIKKINCRWKIKIPGPLVVVVIYTFFSFIFNLESNCHIGVVGNVPSGIPLPSFPVVTHDPLQPGQEDPDTNWFRVALRITPGALVLVLVGFISSVSIGAKFGEKFHYKIDPNQELIALGASDFLGSFFLCFPVGASLSRTAVNAQSGAVSQVASFISTAIIVLSVFLLTPIVYYLPKAILSSIVIMAVVDMVEYQMAIELWKVHRKDLMLFCVSFFSTICLGILQGIIIGMVGSLLLIVYNSAYPPFAVLGRMPGTETYKNIKRVQQAETFKGIRVVRIDGSIYFANTAFIKKKLIHYEPFHKNPEEDLDSDEETLTEPEEPIRVTIDNTTFIGAIILDFSSVNDIDSTGIRMLKELVDDFRTREIVIYFASVKGYVRDRMKKGGVVEHYGADHFFWTINDAVEHHLYLLRQAKRQQPKDKNTLIRTSLKNSITNDIECGGNNVILDYTTQTDEYNNLDGIPLKTFYPK
ncbi:Sulfate transporter [Tieghemostelium lacteum]|uniref:Sulfate transporter n=1 Tax=Tieghemostelium lacteum TaxID=361077 RepID=A0A151ZBD1_TIELA|nr:Sulfate transporter [Tieghemostelium lacteum]|eukprot:KYQ91249.1 Sulfate transporter [Tieghemostelium lacteum]